MAMFNLEKSIKQWLKQFRKHRAFNHGSIREMELHIRDHIEDLIGEGLTEEKAFNKAVDEFGDIQPMATEEYWNKKSKSIYNSTLYSAMFNNYFKIALRNLWNHKFYAFINIIGLTLGLSIVFIIGLFVSDELGFDQFHVKRDQLYRVVENQYYAEQPVFPVAVTPTALGPSLKEEYPEILNFTRVSRQSYMFEVGDSKIMENNGIMVDANFFDMLSFPIIKGDLKSFENKPSALILTQELVDKYFPDKDPIGELIRLSDEEYEITGVIDNVPQNSHLNFRYITNFQGYLLDNPDRASSWGSNWLYTYVELDPTAKLNNVNEKIVGQIKANSEGSVTDIYLQPLTNIYLGEVDFVVEVQRKGEMMYVNVFSLMAIFILLISCINFMNLSTARSAKRSKEVGLRKTVGASRGQLIFQFLGESVLFTIIAVVLSLLIAGFVLPSFNQLANKEFEIGILISSANGLKFLIIIITTTLFTGLVAGSYPAIVLSAAKPVNSISSKTGKGKQGSILRRVLVVLQFAISVILIIGTTVVYQQLQHIQNVDLGYNKDNIIYTFAPRDKAQLFAEEVKQQHGVINAGLSNQHPAYVLSSSSGFDWPGSNAEETILIHYMSVDENYMETMGITLLEGRQFMPSDTGGVMINERALELMGLDDPVGQIIEGSGENTIVGVVKDFNFKSIHVPIEPLVIFMTPQSNRVYIKYEESEQENIAVTVENVWKKVFPDREFDYFFLSEDFNDLYEAEQRTSTLSTIFASLAIIISCLGLFGLVAYATEQRTKEVGIRKVLGASVNNLFLLLSGDFTKLVLISLFISIPVGWLLMDKWLESFAYRTDLSVWVFVLSGASALLIAIFTVSYQTIRTAIGNPVQALRNE